MEVVFSRYFRDCYANFSESDRRKIYSFYEHVKKHGLVELEGRNKNSDNVHKDDPNFLEKVAYAIKHKLWHYHIGIVRYDLSRPFGHRTSEWVLHYVNESPESIKIADLDWHPPFRLPTEERLD